MIKGGFEHGGLYDLLPSVVRHRDSLIREPLKNKLMEFGGRADRLESDITASYANFFVETCGRQELAHIADLIGYRPIFAQPSEEGDSKSAESAADWTYVHDPSKPALRRDVAKTIWARRRKGTAEVLGAIVRLITGWHAVVFENNREVVSTPSIRFASAPRSQGTPDFRRLVGRNRIDQGPGLIARVATVRRIDTSGPQGRWHPLDVVVEAWSLRASLQHDTLLRNSEAGHYLTLADDQQLYAPADACNDATEKLQSARAIRMSDFGGPRGGDYKAEIYGEDRAVCLYQPNTLERGSPDTRTRVAIAVSDVTFGPVTGLSPSKDGWLIDPERGRVQRPIGNSGSVYLRHYVAHGEEIGQNLEDVMTVRLAEHVPMEARAGVVCRPVCHPNKGETNAN
ncbi:hypothetical protein [Rhizobium leguminosarum]|uniref:hypothetical protein n=1 Tax=Rhizobium leguminosarum TaxID=384 RepID=UPI00103F77A9|nr:hypothetical protein [Rhizobium leguminosarum]NKK29627.1 hypothetical protein [Rhizobium leguminosarum bv. viciae]TBZ54192.1 hypothetical protein E0H42_14215 [Rhizobium leguminosarum bv. viciae]